MLCIWLHTFTDLCMLCIWLHTVTGICIQWPNLKNLSGGLNLSRGLNMVGSTYQIVSNVSRFKPALNLNWVLADLNRGSNSLNSISGFINGIKLFKLTIVLIRIIGSPKKIYIDDSM